MLEVIPSILSTDPSEAKGLLGLCEGKARRAHLDIIDGVFAKNKTVDPNIFKDFETHVLLDYHLMVKNPISWIQKCVYANADRIIGQIEMMPDQEKFVRSCIEAGIKSGLGIDLTTPVSSISKEALALTDIVLVMSVNAGFGGQEFSEESLPKIEELVSWRDSEGLNFSICDDGGITMETISLTKGAGVDEVVIGRRLFHGDLSENIDHFKKSAS